MQVTLTKKTLQSLVSGFGKLIGNRTSIPVLGHVLFAPVHTKGHPTGSIRATDLEQTLTRFLAADETRFADGSGQPFLFPFAELKKLRDSLKAGDAAVLTPVGPAKVEISTGVVSRTVGTMEVEEFPEEPTPVPLLSCEARTLLAAMRRAATTASRDASRLILNGVYLDPEKRAAVGTDGRRLTLVSLSDMPEIEAAILPSSKALDFMLSVAAPEGGLAGVAVGKDNRRFAVRTGDWCWDTRCIEGTYPNYSQVIPDENSGWNIECRLGETAVRTLTAAAGQLPSETSDELSLALSPRGMGVFVPDNGGHAGTVLTDCEIRAESPLIVSVDRKFLLDALKLGFRRLRMVDHLTPIRFDDAESGDIHILMPMRGVSSEEARDYAAGLLGEASWPEDGAEPETEATGESPPPAPETPAEPDSAEPQPQPRRKETMTVTKPKPIPETDDDAASPIRELSRLVAETQESVRAASNSLREVKKQAVALERHFRSEERKIRSREQDMAKNLKLIEKLQEAVAA